MNLRLCAALMAGLILALAAAPAPAQAPPGYSPRAIFGADDRQAMDTAAFPWSVIGRLAFADGSSCSGALIAPDVVLTAAHCVLSEGAPTADGVFITARARADGPFKAGLGEVRILDRLARSGNMRAALALNGDWALVRLDRALGDTLGYLDVTAAVDNRPRRPDLFGALAMVAVTALAAAASHGRVRLVLGGLAGVGVLILAGLGVRAATAPDWRRTPIAQAGYSFDTGAVLSGVDACRVLRFRPSGLIEHDCDIADGDSGSPLLVRDEDGWTIIAVVSFTQLEPGGVQRAFATAARDVPDPARAFDAGEAGSR